MADADAEETARAALWRAQQRSQLLAARARRARLQAPVGPRLALAERFAPLVDAVRAGRVRTRL